MIFYTYYDYMSGGFYFSIIPKNWFQLPEGKELPFDCVINKVETLDAIIDKFVSDPCKGVILLSETVLVDPSEEDEDDEGDFKNSYVLDVWSTVL